MRTIVASTFFRAPFSATIDSIADYFKTHPSIEVSPVSAGYVDIDVQHAIIDDDSDSVRKHDALELRWLAPSHMLPSLEALLTVRPHAPGTIVRLTGQYVPPYGIAGRVFDFFIGRIVAALTLRRLLRQLREHVEQRFAHRYKS